MLIGRFDRKLPRVDCCRRLAVGSDLMVIEDIDRVLVLASEVLVSAPSVEREVIRFDDAKVARIQQLGGLALDVYVTIDPHHFRLVVRDDCHVVLIARQLHLNLAFNVTNLRVNRNRARSFVSGATQLRDVPEERALGQDIVTLVVARRLLKNPNMLPAENEL